MEQAEAELKFYQMPPNKRIDLLLRYFADQENNTLVTDYEKGILERLFNHIYPISNGINDSEQGSLRDKTISIMTNKKLIEWNQFGTTHFLAPHGLEIINEGGWIKSVRNEKGKRFWNQFSVKAQVYNGILTLILLVLSAYLANEQFILQKAVNNREHSTRKDVEKLQRRIDSLETLYRSTISPKPPDKPTPPKLP